MRKPIRVTVDGVDYHGEYESSGSRRLDAVVYYNAKKIATVFNSPANRIELLEAEVKARLIEHIKHRGMGRDIHPEAK